MPLEPNLNWICPDLTPYWRIGQLRQSDRFVLSAIDNSHQLQINDIESYALRHFTGQYSIEQIQQQCEQTYGDRIEPYFIQQLLQKLIATGILTSTTPIQTTTDAASPKLKAAVHWVYTSDEIWILRNPEDITFLQVSATDKQLIDDLATYSPQQILQSGTVDPNELQHLLKLLAATGMLEGTTPVKPPKPKKWNPLQLLSFKLRLFNPDPILNQFLPLIQWIWTKAFFQSLLFLLSLSLIYGLNQRGEIIYVAQHLTQQMSTGIFLAFISLSALVVTLHEFGHAFTLKRYQGIVPEMGLMFMCLMPVAYTNTTDQYSLPKRKQRLLVVGAGLLCQLMIAAITFWLWNSSASGSWMWTASYLTMSAALFTVAVNLNPLAKFDGYYLAVALTGINNLRARSMQQYRNWLTGKPSQEHGSDRWILAAYAPFSILYTIAVFGTLLIHIGMWIVDHIPMTGGFLFAGWLVYYFMPEPSATES